jgi:hypothetical protein
MARCRAPRMGVSNAGDEEGALVDRNFHENSDAIKYLLVKY